MAKFCKYIRFLYDSKFRWSVMAYRGMLNWIPDEMFVKKSYKLAMGAALDLENPKTFNEKIQWLKLYDRKPEYTTMVDKYAVKKYVASIIGEEYVIPTLGVWERFDDIDFDALPEQFVLKTTHDSGGIAICQEKKTFNWVSARKKLEKCLKYNYYWMNREWPYKDVPPKIIAEKYLSNEEGDLTDYKFFCFDGKPEIMFVATDRASKEETKFDFFDMNFDHLPFTNGHPNAKKQIEQPPQYKKMKELASILSEKIPHVRVDFYVVNGQVYFGELTFFHWSGLVPFDPPEWDKRLGDLIKLPERK